MDKDKILDYVRKTPANTNPNVLKTMLDGSGSEMNPGYSCTETVTLLTDESVTTVFDEVNNSGKLAYSTSIDADTIRVTFDGTEYTCNAQEGEMGTLYGAPMGEEGIDWSEYPFQISSGLRNDIYTETAGTYQIKVETVEEVVETTPCFEKAVNSVIGGSSGGGMIMAIPNEDATVETLNKTVSEIFDMLSSGGSPFVVIIDSEDFASTPFYNIGYVTKILHSDRDGSGIVSVSGQEGELTYTAAWNDYPSRPLSGGQETIE